MIKSKEILSKVNTCEIFYIDSAISSDNLLKFITDDKGSANHLLDNGNVEVKVSTLDNLVDENVDYIKLDIEGEELNAIIGSNRIIKECKPYLAVCIYHNQSHFWQIPISILNINPYYRIYLRHYTEGIFETVMYFI
jgi:FkbM family methyltransferase